MSSFDKEMRNAVEFVPDRLYFVALSNPPPISVPNKHFFCIDNEMVYWNFYLDFGPLNLAHVYRYCQMVNSKLNDSKLASKAIYHYSHTHAHKRTNAAFLICAWNMLYNEKMPEEAFRPFKNYIAPFPPWHDATPSSCSFILTILDTLRGMHKARECRFFDFNNFNVEEYEHYEQVENGDLNWCVEGKFLAFAGPHTEREFSPGGYHTLRPEDYVPYFRKKNVSLVIRLNKSYYEPSRFTKHGIDHADMYFLDGSNPPDPILAKFIQRCEETPGAVAVHCKAGLGRTGSCIGSYIMKHFRFTAEEIIGWLRIVRPGSVIGPQQQFLKDIQQRMWRDGELYRARLTQQLPAVVSAKERESADGNGIGNGRPGSSASNANLVSPGPLAPTTPQSSSSAGSNGALSGVSTRRMSKLAVSSPPLSANANAAVSAAAVSSGERITVSSRASYNLSGLELNSSSSTRSNGSGGSNSNSNRLPSDFKTPPVSPSQKAGSGAHSNGSGGGSGGYSNGIAAAAGGSLSNYFRGSSASGSGRSPASAAALASGLATSDGNEKDSTTQGDLLRLRRAQHLPGNTSSANSTSSTYPGTNPAATSGGGSSQKSASPLLDPISNSGGTSSRPRSRIGSLLSSWK